MSPSRTAPSIAPGRWPSERPLFALVLLASTVAWLLLILSIAGLLWALLAGLFIASSRLAFVAHLRGSALLVGPEQLPELHARVEELAREMGMEPPEVFVMQAGGALNALATRFLRRDIVVLYSDLLEACGEDEAARDMILGHELAHLRCGHLRWVWFTLPGQLIPFLGSALSRAREYTCDRFGFAAAGEDRGALRGLAILAAGPRLGASANLDAFARQREDLTSGVMTVGEWLASHPPLSKRIAELEPTLAAGRFRALPGRVAASLLLLLGGAVSAAATAGLLVAGSQAVEPLGESPSVSATKSFVLPDSASGSTWVQADFGRLAAFIDAEWEAVELPGSLLEIRDRWAARTGDAFPVDPFDAMDYGYERVGEGYRLWSSGPDGRPGTLDDIVFERPGG